MRYYFISINFPGTYKPDFPSDISAELKCSIINSVNDCSGVWNVFYKTDNEVDQAYIEATMIKPISGHKEITEEEYISGIDCMKELNDLRDNVI